MSIFRETRKKKTQINSRPSLSVFIKGFFVTVVSFILLIMPIVRPSSLWNSVEKLHLNDKITTSCLKKYVSLASYQTFQTTKRKFEEHLRSISITGSVVFAKLAMMSLAAAKTARIPDACPKICTVGTSRKRSAKREESNCVRSEVRTRLLFRQNTLHAIF